MTTVGAAIREARTARGLSQETLAEVLGCDRSSVGLLETGKRGLSHQMARKLAAAFGGEPIAWWRLDQDRVATLPPRRRQNIAAIARRAERKGSVVAGGRTYTAMEAAAVIEAARAVFRSAGIAGQGVAVTVRVHGKTLWDLGTALDAPERGERTMGEEGDG